MNKPLFLLCPGIAKCRTSSLYSILKTYNTYIHTGIKKENFYLSLADLRRNSLNYTWLEHVFNEDLENQLLYPNSINNLKTQLPEKIYSKWTSGQYSLSTYAQYYLSVYEIVKPIYHGVGDFSVYYSEHEFTDEYLQEIDDYLSNFFTVKVVLMFREPVKRLFSYAHMYKTLHHCDSAIDLFYQYLSTPKIQTLYPDVYHKFHRIFGDRLFLLNENFFDLKNPYQKNQFEKFLNLPPINIKDVPPINTQVYTENLQQSDIIEAKKLLKPSYDFYNQTFYT